MEYVTAVEYYNAIDVIEAQACLTQMKVGDYYTKMKQDSRDKLHKEIRKSAYPRGLFKQKEISFEDFIGKMKNG